MHKPDEYELETAIEVLEYIVADLQQNEPHAINTIADIEAVLEAMPRSEDELGDV